MPEVASSYMSIMPSAKGFQSALEGQVSSPIQKTGSKMGGLLGGALKKGAVGVAAAAGGVIGTALFKGFSRLDAIDQAKHKLLGLGNSAKTVDKIMANALASVKGTAFGLDQAATTAGAVVAAGIKPGQQLTGVLKTVADTATIAGASMSDMGQIFGSVAARGKLQGDDLMQLQSRGIPVLATLAKHYGITAQAASKMVSDGKVDFKNFSEAMHERLGGAALQSGKTVSGAFANLKASLGRIGANLLGSSFGSLPGLFAKITGGLDKLEGPAKKAGDALARVARIGWSKLQSGFKTIKGLTKVDFSKIDTKKLGEALADGVFNGLGKLAELGGKLLDALGKVDWVGLGIKAGKLALPFAIGLAAGVVDSVTDWSTWKGIATHWEPILGALVAVMFAPAKWAGKLAEVLGKIPFAGKFLAAVVKGLNSTGGKLKDFFGDLFSTAWKAFTREFNVPGAKLVTKIVGALKSLPGKLKDFFSTLITKVGVWALDMAEKIGSGLGKAPGKAFSALSPLKTKVLDALKGAGKWLIGTGKNIVHGLIKGIGKLKEDVIDALLALIPGPLRKFASKLGINSPSKVYAKLAESIPEGIALGITRGGWRVDDAMARLTKRLASGGKRHKSLRNALLASFLEGSRDKDGKLSKAARKTAERLAKQIAKGLRSSKNSVIGKALGKLLDNIKLLPDGMAKSVKKMSKAADSMVSRIGKLQAKLKSIASSVADAWRPSDLFSGTIGALSSGLSQGLAGLKAVKAVLPTLARKGLKGDFLNQLMGSGNTGLILTLASSNASAVKDFQKQYNQIQSLSSKLGNQVAQRDPAAAAIDRLDARLDHKLDQLRKAFDAAPEKTGRAVGKVINHSAAAGFRRARVA